jgi:hypothetical protein
MGYQLIETRSNRIIAGERFDLTLAEVDDCLVDYEVSIR